VQRIDLTKERPELEVAADAGRMYEESFVDLLIEETCEVYTPRGGLLAKYLNGIISLDMAQKGYLALRDSAGESRNRGLASGLSKGGLKKDGTVSRTTQTDESVRSGIVGFYDRYTRIPYCRQTAWTMDNPEKFMKALPVLQLASDTFEVLIPDRYQAQKRYVESTHREWIIPGTVFTTITVNSNWQTAQHQDSGDLRAGFGVMVCLGHDFEGGWLLFPKYKTAFGMRPGDILLSNVHEWHCNTPIKLLKKGAERLSLVCYYRENMERCGTVQEELETAKNRQEGDPIWEPEAPLFR
jgi:Oxygenase domain of the 2OGFeDO superfamily